MADIFISYASPDREHARRLAEHLGGLGHSVWWDRTIPPGRQFDEVIQEALTAAKCVVVLWSAHSVRSNWVKTEAAEALSLGRLVPALIENVAPPMEFKRIQAANLSDWSGDAGDPELRSLIASIDRLLKQPRSSAPAAGLEPESPRLSPRTAGPRWVRATAVAAGVALCVAVGLVLYLRVPGPAGTTASGGASSQLSGPVASTSVSRPLVPDPPPAADPPPEPVGASPGAPSGPSGRVNLLAPDNGGEMLTATSEVWLSTVDGKEATYGWVEKGEAVFGFKNGRSATFDTVAVFIPGREDSNVREFELLAGNEGPLGRFERVGAFTTQNLRMIKQPYQAFRFAPVRAKYVKLHPLSAHAANYAIAVYEFQLLGSLD